MTTRDGAVAALVAHVDAAGSTSVARRRYGRWMAASPGLDGWRTAAEAAAYARASAPAVQDRIVADLLRAAPSDRLAQLAAVAVVARGLGSVMAGWRRCGLPTDVLAGKEAELVAGAWEAAAELGRLVGCGGGLPPAPARVIVDRARDRVRSAQRREARRAAHQVVVGEAPIHSVGDICRSGEEALTVALGEAVAAGRVGLGPARALYLTRVAGWPTATVAGWMGTSPGAVRVLRGRAAERLAA